MPDNLFSVAGQVVLVSGASRGIGRALAEGFAGRGASVIITGREQATLEQTARAIRPPGGTVRPLVCDVTDNAAIDRLVQAVLGEFGRIDTLLNVAGVNRRMPAEHLTGASYDFIMDVNLKRPFLLSLAVGKPMLERSRATRSTSSRSTTTGRCLPDRASGDGKWAGLKTFLERILLSDLALCHFTRESFRRRATGLARRQPRPCSGNPRARQKSGPWLPALSLEGMGRDK
jgi:NAD(P)-dependent dehydrogenase (short-subunit alcohol dehydrogenase family)